jgi:hypothetical protein
VRCSFYCFGTDVLGEGAGTVLDNVARRAGVGNVTMAVKYHAVSDVYPHNPRHRALTSPPGAFYRTDSRRYDDGSSDGGLRPTLHPLAAGRDVLGELCEAAAAREMGVDAWAVLLHHDEASAGPDLQVNCFGEEMAGAVCPSGPRARRFAEVVVEELCGYPITTLRLESAHFHGFGHGHHHQRLLEDYGAAAELVLGLCFCQWCLAVAAELGADGAAVAAASRRSLGEIFDGRPGPPRLDAASVADLAGPEAAAYLKARETAVAALVAPLVDVARRRGKALTFVDPTIASASYAGGTLAGGLADLGTAPWQFGIDPSAVAATGAVLEATGYLKDPAVLQEALAAYGRLTAAAGARFAVVLRPGPPDCSSGTGLAANVAAAVAAGASEVNFYNYGLYRWSALDRTASALAALGHGRPALST